MVGKTKTQLKHARDEGGRRGLLPAEANRNARPATSDMKVRVGVPASPNQLCNLAVHILARKAPAFCNKTY